MAEVVAVRFLVFGNLTIDDTVMPDGRTAMASVGGNAVYATIGARIWTDDVLMVSRKGVGYPQQVLDSMAKHGFRLDGLLPSQYHAVRQWQLYDVEGGRTYVPLTSSGSYLENSPAASDIPEGLDAGLQAVHIAPMPMEAQKRLVAWAKARGARIQVDPHHDFVNGHLGQWKELLPEIDVFMPSREELESLLHKGIDILEGARELASYGPAIVAVKLGAGGALVYKRSGEAWQIPAYSKNPVDTTGCGDAFCGGFLTAFGETGDPVEAGVRGTVSSSFVLEDFGAEHAFSVDKAEAALRAEYVRTTSRSL